jgi:hypothetical protein
VSWHLDDKRENGKNLEGANCLSNGKRRCANILNRKESRALNQKFVIVMT